MASASTSAASRAAAPAPISASTHLGLLPEIPRASSIIVIGMAGSGKSTFTAALHDHLHEMEKEQQDAQQQVSVSSRATSSSPQTTAPYMVNLDPAVGTLGYEPNVDIRDTVDYARVMEQYNLGPNGGILTALNLFTTKFDQVLTILEKRANEVDHIVLDTPGQIEIFTWSASGSIVTDALASSMPTVVAYIIDTPRTTAPATFMSNMLYACSILYKTKLPFILVFNKTDAQSHQFALEWMQDFEKFQQALAAGNATDPSSTVTQHGLNPKARNYDAEGSQGYMNSLMNSMSLVLDEFYKNLRAVGVSSVTGEGMDDFLTAVQEARQEYLDDYRPELERLAKQRDAKRESSKKEQLARLMKDMKVGSKSSSTHDTKSAKRESRSIEDLSKTIDEEYEGDGQIIEPDSDEEKPHYEYPGPEYDRGDGTVWPRPG
ncbi:related to XPA binding protein [Melanopsichium pennsylvanicum]|uniref:GPN-loop GTPase n=1 Tax=Melanopsichium pennsylvanicum TaxID=63383 RepID=A0AAJ4XJB6_9BASI|nr:related to XPA binding protein [Melanopsichium pennsylvanicum]